MASMPLSLLTPTSVPTCSCKHQQMAYSPKSQIRRRQLRTRTSAQDREPALLGQPVQRGLHHRTDVLVHLGDVGVLAELRGDVDRLEDLGDNLRFFFSSRRRHT